jgi:hypothetical protein
MSRKQRLKARDKVSNKMSRDGLIERNLATGEDTRVSRREADADLIGGKQPGDTYLQLDKSRNVLRESAENTSKKKKQKQRRIAEQSARAENTTSVDIQSQTPVATVDVPKQADAPQSVQPDAQPFNQPHIPQKAPSVKSKPPPIINEPSVIDGVQPPHMEKSVDAPRSALNHEDGGKSDRERTRRKPWNRQTARIVCRRPTNRLTRRNPKICRRLRNHR